MTAASASAAAIGQSLTRRGRNSSLRVLTGHDVEGFAEHDWRELARPGATAAIYMGVNAATFLRGRLMMHGAAGATPVTAVENASRPDQRVIATTLIDLPAALAEAAPEGPVTILFGLDAAGSRRCRSARSGRRSDGAQVPAADGDRQRPAGRRRGLFHQRRRLVARRSATRRSR